MPHAAATKVQKILQSQHYKGFFMVNLVASWLLKKITCCGIVATRCCYEGANFVQKSALQVIVCSKTRSKLTAVASQPLQHTAIRRSHCKKCTTWRPLQHTATHCHTLRYIAATATHCNTLQHTATHCNTSRPLQHTATHCNTSLPLQHTAILHFLPAAAWRPHAAAAVLW